LVLANIASFRELWNGAALFVDPDHEAGWAEALNDLAESESLRSELAAAAWRRAGSYSTERMVEGYLAAYEMLGSRQRSTLCAS
jgi:glycosyltransferase involved in cell wall biosynthesis